MVLSLSLPISFVLGASPAPDDAVGFGGAPPALHIHLQEGTQPRFVLTAWSLADDLDPPLLVALGFLQLTLVAVGGIVGATDRSHHHRASCLLADTGGLGGVGGAALAHRPKPTQHPSAGWGQR